MDPRDLPASAMTLLDYFAAASITSISRELLREHATDDDIAEAAYARAEAMLRARANVDRPTSWPALRNTDFSKGP